MKIQERIKPRRLLLGRLGRSRQIAIPKQLHDALGLSAGDIVEFERKGNKIILTPQDVIERSIREGREDIRKGRVSPAFSSAEAAIRYLHRHTKKSHKEN
ncbi:MAG: AbrB/MazE/SpoVT family DNA-binding domain-containing protein [Patescibacteria group bacterium]